MRLSGVEARDLLRLKLENIERRIEIAPAPHDACPACGGSKIALIDGAFVPCPACTCPTCHNVGFVIPDVPIGDPRFGKAYPCPGDPETGDECRIVREQREKRQRANVQYASLPDGYADCTFASFDRLPDVARAGKEIAREFVELWARAMPAGGWVDIRGDVRNWILLEGTQGVGKTGLAAAAVNYLIAIDQPALYIRLQDLIGAVQDRYGEPPPAGYRDGFGQVSAGEVIAAAETAPVLIIDEFDVPDVRENKIAIVEKIVRYRHGRRLPMLITTNCNERQSTLRWGPTITSVLYASAHSFVVRGARLRKAAAVWGDDR